MAVGQKIIEALVNRGFYFTDRDTKLVEEAVEKELVAYMLVPRCDTCAHWTTSTQECAALRTGPLNVVFTSQDFGCVKWSAR